METYAREITNPDENKSWDELCNIQVATVRNFASMLTDAESGAPSYFN